MGTEKLEVGGIKKTENGITTEVELKEVSLVKEKENLDMEFFHPARIALENLIAEKKDIIIKGIDDKLGYDKAKEYKSKLVKARTSFLAMTKKKREDAVVFQKAVLDLDKKFLKIIEPVEGEIEKKIEAIDTEKIMIKRREQLSLRKSQLSNLNGPLDLGGYETIDELLLDLSDEEFAKYYTRQEQNIIALEQAKLQKEREEMEKEKQELECQKEEIARKEREEKEKKEREELEAKHKEELEKAKVEAENKAKEEIKKEQEKKSENIVDKIADIIDDVFAENTTRETSLAVAQRILELLK
jgi:hypothetical protein